MTFLNRQLFFSLLILFGHYAFSASGQASPCSSSILQKSQSGPVSALDGSAYTSLTSSYLQTPQSYDLILGYIACDGGSYYQDSLYYVMLPAYQRVAACEIRRNPLDDTLYAASSSACKLSCRGGYPSGYCPGTATFTSSTSAVSVNLTSCFGQQSQSALPTASPGCSNTPLATNTNGPTPGYCAVPNFLNSLQTVGLFAYTLAGSTPDRGPTVVQNGDVATYTTPIAENILISPGRRVVNMQNAQPYVEAIYQDLISLEQQVALCACDYSFPPGTYEDVRFTQGVWCYSGDIVLSGNPSFTFDVRQPSIVVRVAGSVRISSETDMSGMNIYLPGNVLFMVSGALDVGCQAVILGTYVALRDISLAEATSVSGRLLSVGGAVRLDVDIINVFNSYSSGAYLSLTRSAQFSASTSISSAASLTASISSSASLSSSLSSTASGTPLPSATVSISPSNTPCSATTGTIPQGGFQPYSPTARNQFYNFAGSASGQAPTIVFTYGFSDYFPVNCAGSAFFDCNFVANATFVGFTNAAGGTQCCQLNPAVRSTPAYVLDNTSGEGAITYIFCT